MIVTDSKSQLLLERAVRALEAIAKHTRYLTPPQVLTNSQEPSLADLEALTTPADDPHNHTISAGPSDHHRYGFDKGYQAHGQRPYTMRDAEREQRDRAVGLDKGYQAHIESLMRDLAGKDEIIEDLNDELNHQKSSSSKALKRLAGENRKNVNKLLAQLRDQQEQNAEARRVVKNYAKAAEAARKDTNTLKRELRRLVAAVAGVDIEDEPQVHRTANDAEALLQALDVRSADDGGI